MIFRFEVMCLKKDILKFIGMVLMPKIAITISIETSICIILLGI